MQARLATDRLRYDYIMAKQSVIVAQGLLCSYASHSRADVAACHSITRPTPFPLFLCLFPDLIAPRAYARILSAVRPFARLQLLFHLTIFQEGSNSLRSSQRTDNSTVKIDYRTERGECIFYFRMRQEYFIIILFIYYYLVRAFRLWTSFRFYISFTYYPFTFYQSYGVITLLPPPLYLSKLFSLSISLFLYIYLSSCPLYYMAFHYILSLKLWQLLGFCLLAVPTYCRSSPSCIALLFSIIVFNSISPSPVSFSIFSVSFGPPVISYSSITCLRSSSFPLHSLHLFSPSSFQYSLALVWFPHLNLANIFLSFRFILPSKYFGNSSLAIFLFCFSLSPFFYDLVYRHLFQARVF